jgi:predicted ATPase/Tfp pilus assembly protein PilF
VLGREHEIAAVRDYLLIASVRLLTLTGPPGIGKTRLAVQVAASLISHFPDGVFFVGLAPISDPALVAATVAQTVGVREDGSPPVEDGLRQYLRGRTVLLVLDNFEQVVGAASLVTGLLAACPGVKALVTSRAPLHVRGERQWPVPPLAVPGPTLSEQELADPARLGRYAGVALFVRRARASQPAFALTPANATQVAAICTRLDGLPLALELAAARIRLLTPEAILQRLEGRLNLLVSGPRDLPVRQQTLRAAIAWSYDLLAPDEQALFRRLAVFVGGCTLEAAEQVANVPTPHPPPPTPILDGLSSLLDKSLLGQVETTGESRFIMLETIREYAREQLAAREETAALRHRHGAYYFALATAADPHLRGAHQEHWLDRLDRDHDNLRAALDWAHEQDEVGALLNAVAVLWRFWWVRGHHSDWASWMEVALAARGRGDPPVWARIVHGAGILADARGDYARAEAFYRESLALRRELDDLAGAALMLNNLGHLALMQGRPGEAIPLLEESLALSRAAGDTWGSSFSLKNLGRARLEAGDYREAQTLYEESLAVAQVAHDNWSAAISLQSLGEVALRQGDYRQAHRLYHQSLALERELESKAGIAGCLVGLAEVARALAQPERAARLYGATEAAWEAMGNRLSPTDQAGYDQNVAALRATLDPTTFADAWAAGRLLTLEQAARYATEDDVEPTENL